MDAIPDTSIRQNLDQPSPGNTPTGHARSRWEHPLTLLVIGFLLSGVIGALISSSIQSRQLQRDRERQRLDAEHDQETQHYESSTKAIVDFSNALYLRYVRAGMLKSALSRGASSAEIRHRKDLYDEALVQQESTVLSSHLLIREGLKEQDYDDWETQYQYALKPRLSYLDKELTNITDAYLRNPKQGAKVLSSDWHSVNELYEEVRVCDSAMINAIFRSLSSKQYLSGKTVIDTQQKAKDDVNAQCPVFQKPIQGSDRATRENGISGN